MVLFNGMGIILLDQGSMKIVTFKSSTMDGLICALAEFLIDAI